MREIHTFEWAVIGAGPSGIASVGKLLDFGIPHEKIAWIDPCFTVGDFGTLWRNVPSNTRVGLFLKFLRSAKSFLYDSCKKDFALNHADPEKTCDLKMMAEPLQFVTEQLRKNIHSIVDLAESISLSNRCWKIEFKNTVEIKSRNIILATGAEPKQLNYPTPIIPLKDAMDRNQINPYVNADDTVAVFGSSHSAILVLKNLVESKVKCIINFYRSPLRYAIYLDDWILFDDTGLKGPTATWARENIDGNLPQNLSRHITNEENIENFLPQCTKVVYAIGFERRLLPVIKNVGHTSYIEQCGIIAPGLFGVGIAYPEAKLNPVGMMEYRVGLWKFMDYLTNIIPIWLQYKA